MLKLRCARAIPNVITYLSFVFPINLIWVIYYIVTQKLNKIFFKKIFGQVNFSL
jgi:hypothetical protein